MILGGSAAEGLRTSRQIPSIWPFKVRYNGILLPFNSFLKAKNEACEEFLLAKPNDGPNKRFYSFIKSSVECLVAIQNTLANDDLIKLKKYKYDEFKKDIS